MHSDYSDADLPSKPVAISVDSDSEDDVILQQVLRKSLYDTREHCHGASGSRADEANSSRK